MIVDASVWVAYFLPQDRNHAAGTRWINHQLQIGTPLFVPDLVFPEVSGPVSRVSGSTQDGLAAADRVRNNPAVHRIGLDPPLMNRATDLAARLRVKGADAVYIAAARQQGITLVTFDKQLAQRAAAVVPIVQL